ncbi:GNAT family N-acetyltransferase [Shewanella cyperi]|uniref:GNAT family N-acetyltransferase n=1 Tax=Shewanella cyperi TaxID=2814292 RepID=A0A974XMG8_9GAMM|nr:GNAT family N-acetyltransferase [Shewanella cyperi]QSX31034.1 GNAT family N-acetyltransferase [Shewanella cyperi]
MDIRQFDFSDKDNFCEKDNQAAPLTALTALLQEHLADMHANSPPGSVHALNLERLQGPDIRLFALWLKGDAVSGKDADVKNMGEVLAACGAIKQLSETEAELKSMRCANQFRGRGLGKAVLHHLLEDARRRGIRRLYLETGSVDFFLPAQGLYLAHGFEFCGPFGDYSDDPFSRFMTKSL